MGYLMQTHPCRFDYRQVTILHYQTIPAIVDLDHMQHNLRVSRNIRDIKYERCDGITIGRSGFEGWYRLTQGVAINLPYHSQALHLDTVFKFEDYKKPICIKRNTLYIDKGFIWNGATVPCFDTPAMVKSAMVHDAIYRLIAKGEITKFPCRYVADRIYYHQLRECGVNPLVRWKLYALARLFGAKYCKP